MRAPRSAVALTLVVAAMVFGCGEKAAPTAADAAAPTITSAALDGGDARAPNAANGDGGATLEDTAMPQSNGEELSNRMRHLLEAVAQNNPDLAGDVLFPREAFLAAKDASDPQKVWEKKISGSFRHGIERSHKHLKGVEHAKFVSFELGHAVTQVPAKKHDYKKALWHVKHSKLNFTVDGKPRHLEIGEMVAWRGSWYVTKLK